MKKSWNPIIAIAVLVAFQSGIGMSVSEAAYGNGHNYGSEFHQKHDRYEWNKRDKDRIEKERKERDRREREKRLERERRERERRDHDRLERERHERERMIHKIVDIFS